MKMAGEWRFNPSMHRVKGDKLSHAKVLPVCDNGCIYKGSYMSAHVLLNLRIKLGKSDKLRGLPNIILLFLAPSLINSIKHDHECNITDGIIFSPYLPTFYLHCRRLVALYDLTCHLLLGAHWD